MNFARGSLPGKTFLVGEYLAIEGGPSIVLATDPRFALEPARHGQAVGFALASPAGHFYARHRNRLANLGFEFRDPHRGKGGLGASSAQFALLYALVNEISEVDPKTFDWKKLLEEYRSCAWSGEGSPPSGADVVAQLTGGVVWFDGREYRARKLAWNFAGLAFTLLRTGTKLATHEHLKHAQAAPHEQLRQAVHQATTAFQDNSAELLIGAVKATRDSLRGSGLTAPGTLSLLEKLDREPWALAAKGCGAMGADVVLVLHDRGRANEVADWAKAQRLEVCGSLAELGQGLRFETKGF